MKYNGKEYYSQGDIYAAIEEQNKLLKEENKNLKERIEKLGKELSAVYKAYHTALGVDYNNEEDLYTIEDIEGHNAE